MKMTVSLFNADGARLRKVGRVAGLVEVNALKRDCVPSGVFNSPLRSNTSALTGSTVSNDSTEFGVNLLRHTLVSFEMSYSARLLRVPANMNETAPCNFVEYICHTCATTLLDSPNTALGRV